MKVQCKKCNKKINVRQYSILSDNEVFDTINKTILCSECNIPKMKMKGTDFSTSKKRYPLHINVDWDLIETVRNKNIINCVYEDGYIKSGVRVNENETYSTLTKEVLEHINPDIKYIELDYNNEIYKYQKNKT